LCAQKVFRGQEKWGTSFELRNEKMREILKRGGSTKILTHPSLKILVPRRYIKQSQFPMIMTLKEKGEEVGFLMKGRESHDSISLKTDVLTVS